MHPFLMDDGGTRWCGAREPLGVMIVSGLTLVEGSRSAPTLLAGGAQAGRAGIGKAAWIGATDIVALLAVVFALPFVILAVGVPVALILNVLLWLGRLL
jgi:hypothetical protein